MNRQQWERIQFVFSTAADLPVEEQEKVVASLCESEPEIANDVLEMLRADAKSGHLLDAKISDVPTALFPSRQTLTLIRQQIGPYRLLNVLGEGGMGVVYLAERTDIEGLVAIKLLRDAWLSPMRRARFTLEQQTLFKLNHPGIARIYDANTMEDGTPWFVMEFADGLPFDEYARQRNGTLVEDLQLFLAVCEAVEYAHSHMVIHRDLKPSNILVTKSGEVKLLDFGIAKQLTHEGERVDTTTVPVQMLTPAYAAPEQIAGGEVGAFTDVYALGVLLYELLTKQRPNVSLSKDGAGIEKPSMVVRRSARAARRHQVKKREWADLDTLCLTALQPVPTKRYRSVDALIRDITAFLEGRALEARAQSFWYTAGKSMLRHRRALAGVAAACAILVATSIVFTVRLAHARDAAAKSRDAAVAEDVRLARLQRFTESLFTGGSGGAGPAVDLKATQLLDRGRVEAENLGVDPVLQADMFAVLGSVYQKLGRSDAAQDLLQKALDEQKRMLGPQNPRYLQTLVSIALLRRDQGDSAQAESLLRQALSLEKNALRPGDPLVEHTLWALGHVLFYRTNYMESRKYLEEAIHAGEQNPVATPQLAQDYIDLADLLSLTGQPDAASVLASKSLHIRQKLLGERDPSVAESFIVLGSIAGDRGRWKDAEDYDRRAIAIDESWYGKSHPVVLEGLNELSEWLIHLKRYDEAQKVLLEVLRAQPSGPNRSIPQYMSVVIGYADLEQARGQLVEAERYFTLALALHERYEKDVPESGTIDMHLCEVYADRGRYQKAALLCSKAMDTFTKTLPARHWLLADAHIAMGHLLLREGEYAEAERETRKGLPDMSDLLIGISHVELANADLAAEMKHRNAAR